MSSCSVTTCDRPASVLGFCASHYKRHQRGTPLNNPLRSYAAGFFGRVQKTDDCWIWLGALMPNGYGRYRIPGHPQAAAAVLAHRYSYEIAKGPIGHGLQLDHLCRNRRCVNPDHLEPVTGAENLRRARAANAEGASA